MEVLTLREISLPSERTFLGAASYAGKVLSEGLKISLKPLTSFHADAYAHSILEVLKTFQGAK